jgi:multidrug resistance efflux pump
LPEIDPQEFGRLQAEVAAQRRDMDRMANSIDTMVASIQAMQAQLAEARGGWKLLLAVGGAGATAGATAGALLAKGAFWWAKSGGVGP